MGHICMRLLKLEVACFTRSSISGKETGSRTEIPGLSKVFQNDYFKLNIYVSKNVGRIRLYSALRRLSRSNEFFRKAYGKRDLPKGLKPPARQRTAFVRCPTLRHVVDGKVHIVTPSMDNNNCSLLLIQQLPTLANGSSATRCFALRCQPLEGHWADGQTSPPQGITIPCHNFGKCTRYGKPTG